MILYLLLGVIVFLMWLWISERRCRREAERIRWKLEHQAWERAARHNHCVRRGEGRTGLCLRVAR